MYGNTKKQKQTGKNTATERQTKDGGIVSVERQARDHFPPTQSVMLKVNMLQAMHHVKFDGKPSDFPVFRKRLIDNLEDGLLTDSQMVEFLPKFVYGEAYEAVKRAVGCSYPDIIEMLEERYGQPCAGAASCIDSLISGPKLANSDYKGLRNFAEQLMSATKKLSSEYEVEASTTSNMKLIVARLPNYFVSKWGDVSYSIKETGRKSKLKDLANFVKRQAAIRNDPAFLSLISVAAVEGKSKFGRLSIKRNDDSKKERETIAYVTNFRKEDNVKAPVKENDVKRFNKLRWSNCVLCSKVHELALCPKFGELDTKERWNIVKEAKLCHICIRPGHFRGVCRSSNYCICGNQCKHHPLLHNLDRT